MQRSIPSSKIYADLFGKNLPADRGPGCKGARVSHLAWQCPSKGSPAFACARHCLSADTGILKVNH